MSAPFTTIISTAGQSHGDWLHENHDQLLDAVAALRRAVEAAGHFYRGYQVWLNDVDSTLEVSAVYRPQQAQSPGQ